MPDPATRPCGRDRTAYPGGVNDVSWGALALSPVGAGWDLHLVGAPPAAASWPRPAGGRVHPAPGGRLDDRPAPGLRRHRRRHRDWAVAPGLQPGDLARDHPGRRLGGVLRGRRFRREPRARGAESPDSRPRPARQASRRRRSGRTSEPDAADSTTRWPRSRRSCKQARHLLMRRTAPGDAHVARNRLWARLNDAVAALEQPLATPLMVVDLDAFDANADDLVRRAGGKPIRVASKSLRVPALLERALARRRLPRRAGLHPARGAVARGAGHHRRHRRSPTRPSTGARWPGWSPHPPRPGTSR